MHHPWPVFHLLPITNGSHLKFYIFLLISQDEHILENKKQKMFSEHLKNEDIKEK